MKKIKVLVIDSGIDKNNNIAASYAFVSKEGKYYITKSDSIDYIGHGTAVTNIILATNPDVDIISLRICDEKLEVDENALIVALQYVYEHMDVDIINISAGITYIENVEDLENVCNLLQDKGIIVISAFDNDGAISYPAAFESVIGVDVTSEYEDTDDMIYVENSVVDVLVPNRYFRTIWLDKKTIIKGTSFACAFVTGCVSKYINNNTFVNKEDIAYNITNKVKKINSDKSSVKGLSNIKKAIIFPINKESNSLLRFYDRLPFEIVAAYDEKCMGKVGKKAFGKILKSYDDIDWNGDFDTIILSCISDLCRMIKRDYVSEIVNKAREFGKQIYSFEIIDSNYENLFYPVINRDIIPMKNLFKLHKSIIPVVAVFGTSSKQGKFTLQQRLINKLKDLEYDVGFLSTEPSGYLFGADEVFHFGYKADINVQPWECISILNEMVWNIQLKGKDLLVTGCQSGIVHYDNSLITDFAIYQYAYLLGVMPDFPIICINPHDDITYIERSISFINSVCEENVKAIAIFPQMAIQTETGIGYKTERVKEKLMEKLKENLQEKFCIPVYSMDDDNIVDDLCKMIIDTFKQETAIEIREM